jgi:hypothetical protein
MQARPLLDLGAAATLRQANSVFSWSNDHTLGHMACTREDLAARRLPTDQDRQLRPWWFATRTRSGALMTICPWCRGPAKDHPLDIREVPPNLVPELGPGPIEVRLCTGRRAGASQR